MQYYTMENLNEYIQNFKLTDYKKFKKKKKEYWNIPCTFDIETTSAYIKHPDNEIIQADKVVELKEQLKSKDWLKIKDNYEKVAWMYVWQVSIDDKLFIGRTWQDFLKFMNVIADKFKLGENRYLIFFIRNLEFEFQFIKHYFTWSQIFATKPHSVIYSRCDEGFEFRCSYYLAGCSLETSGKNLTKYKALKQTGKLDYSLIHTSETKLTEDEINYCLYDVIVDSNFIRESMEQEPKNNLLKMPLTKTGYVRRYVKQYTMKARMHKLYSKIVHSFTMNEQKYNQLKRAFAGGFTHSNALNTGLIFKNVASQDITSSYPASLLLEKYPMSPGRKYKPKSLLDFESKIESYCCIFDIEFKNIKMRDDVYENIISESKCFKLEKPITNNGRVVEALTLAITITDVDFKCIKEFYTYDSIKIANMTIYRKDYLPKELLECVLHFYKSKTELKDVEGMEIEYLVLKGMLNSIYGMMVTDPVRPEIDLINDEWVTNYSNIAETLESYNKKYDRFIVYEWGIYCTAYSRRNVIAGCKELKEDYIYCDTDSLKYTNKEKHQSWFDKYNQNILTKIDAVCAKYNFDKEDFMPKDKYGKIHIIGQFTYEFTYTRFKTLGAKRYMFELPEKGVNLTVSGLDKKVAIPYLKKYSKDQETDIFDLFNDDLFVPGKYSGKLLHTYIDDYKNFKCKDYQGNVSQIVCLSSIHLEPSSYSMSLASKYKAYINNVQTQFKRGD